MKPRLLDLCCCAGGCTKGYQRAGFYVVGVDQNPQMAKLTQPVWDKDFDKEVTQ